MSKHKARSDPGTGAEQMLGLVVTLLLAGSFIAALVSTLGLVSASAPAPQHHLSVQIEGTPIPGLTQETAQAAADRGPTGPTPLTIKVRTGNYSEIASIPSEPGVVTILIAAAPETPSKSRGSGWVTPDDVAVVAPPELVAKSRHFAARTNGELDGALGINLRLGQTVTAINATGESVWAHLDSGPQVKRPFTSWLVAGAFLLAAGAVMLPGIIRRRRERRAARIAWLGARRRVARVLLELDALEVTAVSAGTDAASRVLGEAFRSVRQRAFDAVAHAEGPVPGPDVIVATAATADTESRELTAEADAILDSAELLNPGDGAGRAWRDLVASTLRPLDRLIAAVPSSATEEALATLRPRFEQLAEQAAHRDPALVLRDWDALTRRALRSMGQVPLRRRPALYSDAARPSLLNADLTRGRAEEADEVRSAVAATLGLAADLKSAVDARLVEIDATAQPEGTGTRRRRGFLGARCTHGTRGARRPRGRGDRNGPRKLLWTLAGIVTLVVGFFWAAVGATIYSNVMLERTWSARQSAQDPKASGPFRVSEVSILGGTLPPAEAEELRAAAGAVPLPRQTQLTVVLSRPSDPELPRVDAWQRRAAIRAEQPQLFDASTLEPLPGQVVVLASDGRPNASPSLDYLLIDQPNLSLPSAASFRNSPRYDAEIRHQAKQDMAGQIGELLNSISVAPAVQTPREDPLDTDYFSRAMGPLWVLSTAVGALMWRLLWGRAQQRGERRQRRMTLAGFRSASKVLDGLALGEDNQALDLAAISQLSAAGESGDSDARRSAKMTEHMQHQGVILALRWREELREIPRKALLDSGVRSRFQRFAALVDQLELTRQGTARTADAVVQDSAARRRRKG